MPWDKEPVLSSVRRTGRLVTVEENQMTGRLGGGDRRPRRLPAFGDCRHRYSDHRSRRARPLRRRARERFVPSAEYVSNRSGACSRPGARRRPGGRTDYEPRLSRQVLERRPAAALRRAAAAATSAMVEIRLLEDRVLELFGEGLIAGTTHTSQGQEAVSVALAAATRPTDTSACTYRGHGTALALGRDPGGGARRDPRPPDWVAWAASGARCT